MSSLLRKGAVALVTGGASGLGKATVERFASKGITVYALDKSHNNGNIRRTNKSQVQLRTGDVTKEEDVLQVMEEIRTQEKNLHVVVNCAGIYVVEPAFDFDRDKPQTLEDFRRIFEVNVFGTFNTLRLAIGVMSKNKPDEDGQRGVIINVSSCAREDGSMAIAGYCASKAAVAAMTVPLAREFAHVGVRVVSIAPGPMRTPMLLSDDKADISTNFPKVALFPKRMGDPQEFANLVEFITQNSLINATTINMDGGFRNPVKIT